jgi:hypothetical protein
MHPEKSLGRFLIRSLLKVAVAWENGYAALSDAKLRLSAVLRQGL